jgi:cytoskeletal protein CcmA (bactofilin family)
MITSAKKNPDQAQASNRILSGTEIIGDIKSNGDFRIDGHVKGTITIEGKLVVGEKGSVDGQVICENATISGEFKGKMQVKELLSLLASSKFQGEMVTSKLSVEPGAEFTGSCSMGAVVRDLASDSKDNSSEKTA